MGEWVCVCGFRDQIRIRLWNRISDSNRVSNNNIIQSPSTTHTSTRNMHSVNKVDKVTASPSRTNRRAEAHNKCSDIEYSFICVCVLTAVYVNRMCATNESNPDDCQSNRAGHFHFGRRAHWCGSCLHLDEHGANLTGSSQRWDKTVCASRLDATRLLLSGPRRD